MNRHVHSPRAIGHRITLSRIIHMAAGLALLAVPACNMAAGEDMAEPGMLMADEAGFEVIAELHPDADTTITFTKEPSLGEDGGFAVGVTVRGPGDGVPYESLMAEQRATALELFQALAPAGSTAPEALVEAHRGAVQALGRKDDQVRDLDVASFKLVRAPIQSSVCASYSAFQDFVSAVWLDKPLYGGTREQYTDASSGTHFLEPHAFEAGYLTACNYKSNRVDTKRILLCSRYQDASSGSTDWVCDGVWLDDGERVAKSWDCELNSSGYCKWRYFHISAAGADPVGTTTYLAIVQLFFLT